MSAFQLCAAFDLFAGSTQFLSSFSISGFNFTILGSNPKASISVNGNGQGLRFPNNGMEIVLPVPMTTVNLTIGTFGGPVDISAADSAGNLVRKKSIPEQKRYINMRLSAPEIASLTLNGGRDEAVLTNICVIVSSC